MVRIQESAEKARSFCSSKAASSLSIEGFSTDLPGASLKVAVSAAPRASVRESQLQGVMRLRQAIHTNEEQSSPIPNPATGRLSLMATTKPRHSPRRSSLQACAAPMWLGSQLLAVPEGCEGARVSDAPDLNSLSLLPLATACCFDKLTSPSPFSSW